MSTTTVPPSTPLTWKQADVDVHVATRNGEFAGFVEFDGSAHRLHDERGTDLGSFVALDDAFRALAAAQQPARPAASPLPPRTPRRRMRRARA
ncbi:hypothetical protein [Zhihengliuella sp. ISTPL4]|uniref:hypothetical protein n=1 Tax=Zhihengliuella sp. ISTPL4 TaxID=2058657 RepID=UPI0013052C7E|nr:hypothetical protein [Zhihengliuella sp. ISTPL4]